MLKGKKGITIPVVGTLLVVASLIFLYAITQAVETKQRTVMLKGELAISGENQAELTKRFAELSFASIAKTEADSTAKSCPDTAAMKTTLIENIKNGLPDGISELNKYRTVEWKTAEIEITSTSPTSFGIKGSQVFLFKDSKIGMTLTIPVLIEQTIESGYFKC